MGGGQCSENVRSKSFCNVSAANSVDLCNHVYPRCYHGGGNAYIIAGLSGRIIACRAMCSHLYNPRLDPGAHVFSGERPRQKTWMAGSSPAKGDK